MKKLLLLLAFVFCFFFFSSTVRAEENFLVSSDITYTVLGDTKTRVVMQVNLTNLSSKYYASEYKIRVGFSNISNISVSDPDGPITPDIVKTDDGYIIQVTFNRKVVGVEKTLPFSITFETTDIVKKTGRYL